MAKAKSNTFFSVGEYVVYPVQGVGEIRTIEKRPFKDQDVLYYEIYFETTDMTVMVPVEKAEAIRIRKIISEKEALKALDRIGEDYIPSTADWKTRYQQNLDKLKTGDINDVAVVVRALYDRSKLKELPILERKLYDNAIKLLIDEISIAMKKSKKESETLIFEKLEAEKTKEE